MSRNMWIMVAVMAAAALWWFFLRTPATVRAPVGSTVPASSSGGGILGDLLDRFAQGKTLWDRAFGAPAQTGGSAVNNDRGVPTEYV